MKDLAWTVMIVVAVVGVITWGVYDGSTRRKVGPAGVHFHDTVYVNGSDVGASVTGWKRAPSGWDAIDRPDWIYLDDGTQINVNRTERLTVVCPHGED